MLHSTANALLKLPSAPAFELVRVTNAELLMFTRRLAAGDLFHESKPSRSCIYRTMSILRRHCMGDDPIHVKVCFISS
jgi:hypothetical protein